MSGEQTSKEHYDFLNYMHLARWSCYYIQIKTVLNLKPKKVLEIGQGDGLFRWYIKKNGVQYTSVDHASDLGADVIANLGYEKLPLESDTFDVVCAFQVLEHIPFEKVPYALEELKRVSRKYVFLDIPQYGFHIQFALKIPILRYIQKHFVIPRPVKHKFDGFHYWEISKRGYSVSKIRKLLNTNFSILKEFSIYQNPKERFFLLEKHTSKIP